jgi:restriction endonuclease Mrr
MAVPDFQSLTLPVLKELADWHEQLNKDIRQRVACNLRLTVENVVDVPSSCTQNQVARPIALTRRREMQAELLTMDRWRRDRFADCRFKGQKQNAG